jgi:hypothetical protein
VIHRVCVALLLWPALAAADQQAGPTAPAPAVRWQISDTTRVEHWRFFEPRPGGGDPDYTFVANRLFAGLDYRGRRLDVAAGVQYVQFGGLPTRASGPGALGTGPQYFDQAGRTDSRQVYLRTLHMRLRPSRSGVIIQAGRFGYASGAESTSGNVQIEATKRLRLDSRLIGEFEWSIYQRSFDGLRVDVDRRRWHGTAAWFRPTQGGFEEQAGRPLRHVGLSAVTFSLRPGPSLRRTDVQAFLYRYTDTRAVHARPDNTAVSASSVDIDITSLGTSLVGAYPVARGDIDILGWAVWQRGDWYGQRHAASALATEIGYRPGGAGIRPWLRGGWFRSSGDTSSTDDRHGTFFQMMPTARRYALSTAYNLMNLSDIFGQVIVRPWSRLNVRLDVHRLRLTSAADLWYAGSGATASTGSAFGYAGRRSNGSRVLGTMVEGAADWTVATHLSVNGYVGRLSGGEIVSGTFAGTTLLFAYLEAVVGF